MDSQNRVRCEWCLNDPLSIQYHDEEWGVPLHDERRLLEMLILEGAQAGLSWITVLKKRQNYRAAFDNFDAHTVASYGEAKIAQLLQNSGLIRNRLKMRAAVNNARCFLKVCAEFDTFDNYIWRFTEGVPLVSRPTRIQQMPSSTVLSDTVSKDLRARGFSFVGTTIVYSFLQAIGVVDDHMEECWCALERGPTIAQ